MTLTLHKFQLLKNEDVALLLESCYLQLFCIDFNSMPNLIVILLNHVYHVFYVGFHCMGCV